MKLDIRNVGTNIVTSIVYADNCEIDRSVNDSFIVINHNGQMLEVDKNDIAKLYSALQRAKQLEGIDMQLRRGRYKRE